MKRYLKTMASTLLCLSVTIPRATVKTIEQFKKADSTEATFNPDDYLVEEVEDYEYDGFLDEIFPEAYMDCSEENVAFSGVTSDEFGGCRFYLSLNSETLKFTQDFEDDGFYVECEQAFVNDLGRIDANIDIFDYQLEKKENFVLSDYMDFGLLQDMFRNPNKFMVNIKYECLFHIIKYVIIAELFEQAKSNTNYRNNKARERDGQGVYLGNYIYDQTDKSRRGYKSGGYNFGFTEFSGVGCEVAAVYNLMVDRGKPMMLSDVIYDFERWSIEFATGFGKLGSNPRQINKVLIRYDIPYYRFDEEEPLGIMLNYVNDGSRFIMSNWNEQFEDGLHTYFFTREGIGIIRAYNKGNNKTTYNDFNGIKSLCPDEDRFIVGYYINE